MKKIFFAIVISLAPLLGASEPTPINIALKPRQPNWRFEIVKVFPQGNPQWIQFYEPTVDGERPVKQVAFYENNQIQMEMDVVVVDPESDAAKEWKSPVVPNGTRVEFSSEGQLLKVGSYRNGVLDGECKIYYPNGQLQNTFAYREGKLVGEAKSFYEDGQVKEETFYIEGELEGDVVQYFPNGNRASLYPHHKGLVDGIAVNWFPSGGVNIQRHFNEGALHGNGQNPALIVYDEEQNVIEMLDFRQGQPIGLHTRYHANGVESYRVNYKLGKKEGKEQHFSEAGALLGEGLYQDGAAVGRHWREYPNGTIAYSAEFDREGKMVEPAVEYNEQGVKVRQLVIDGDKLHGPYFEWYNEGTPKIEYNYANGSYDGEQKEYYPSGQLKVCTHYKNQVREGVHEEWHENGILARRAHFVDGLKDGQMAEWYPNGNSKVDAYFIADHPDGVQSEWFENGQLKARAEFGFGLKQGWQREWNEQGDLVMEALFDHDQMQGTVLSWWEKDQVKTRLQFESGKKEGIHKWFYKNGKPERVATFKNDLMEGEMLTWYPDGAIQSVQIFKEGKPVGEHRTYYPKSAPSQKDEERLAHIFHYDTQGKLHGEERAFYEGGKLQAIVAYEHGLLSGKKQMFDQQGAVIEEAEYAQGKMDGRFFQKTADGKEVATHFKNNLKNGPHLIFFPPNQNGEKVKAVEAHFVNDQLEGIVTEYSDKGVKIAETPYVHGLKEGTAKIFAGETKISITIEFLADKKNGLTTQYFPNGKKYRETSHLNDLREGPETTYHEDGQIASIFLYHNDKLNGLAQSWNKEGVLVFEGEFEDDLRNGKFNKYYDDGKPSLEQTFVQDKLDGEKRKYDRDGSLTVSIYEAGEVVR